MRVLMLVYNNVCGDARVQREASALVGAGHSVVVVGFDSSATSVTRTTSDAGYEIRLAMPKADADIAGIPFQSVSRTRRYAQRKGRLLAVLLALTAAASVPTHFWAAVGVVATPDFWAGVGAGAIQHHLAIAAIALLTIIALWFGGLAAAVFNVNLRRFLRRPQLGVTKTITRRWVVLFALVQMELLCDDSDFDVVHCHDLVCAPLALRLARSTGARLVWDAHEIYDAVTNLPLVGRWDARRTTRQLVRAADAVITVSEPIAAEYRRRYRGLRHAKEIVVVANACALTRPGSYDGRLHDRAGLPRSQRILLYQGGFSRHRGLEALIDASSHLTPGWTVVLMGAGSLEPVLRTRSDSTTPDRPRHAPHTVFLPMAPHDELLCWTAGAEVGALLYEPVSANHLHCSPNKLWEYTTAGVPVLATEIGDVGRAIREHHCGWIAPCDPRGLAEFINGLPPNDIAQARANCASFLAGNDWEHYSHMLTDCYVRLSPNRDAKAHEVPVAAEFYGSNGLR